MTSLIREPGALCRGDLGWLAGLLGVDPRTVRCWKRQDPSPVGPGRPAHGESLRWHVLRRVARERRDSGSVTAGWRAVQQAQPELPVRLVQASVAALKARGRRRAAGHRRATRTTLHVACRDVLHSADASHLGRWEDARVHGEAVKDVASCRTLLPTVVPRALRAADTIAKLEALEGLGRLPLVLATDNGSAYVADEVERWLADHQVVHLLNLPHTPQHNAWIERAFRELKAEAALGRGVVLDSPDQALVRLLDARRRLEEHRPRASLGGCTAAEIDRLLPSWEGAVDRGAFHAAVCRAQQEALRDVQGARARRRAVREATLVTLERFGLAYRTRGGARLPAAKAEGIS